MKSIISIDKAWSKKNDQNAFKAQDENYAINDNVNDDLINSKFNDDDKTNHENLDDVDYCVKQSGRKKPIPDDIHISILEVFIYLWGVITFFADFITDIILSIEYYNNHKAWLGSMTLIFVIVPNVTLSLFSLSWYIDKYYSTKTAENSNTGIFI